MWHYVLSRIWRNLLRDIAEIRGRSENFHFQEGLALGLSLIQNRREMQMFYLAEKWEKCVVIVAEKKLTFLH